MQLPQIVSATEWQAARQHLLDKEKAATKARDALAAERRRLPIVAFDKPYRFAGPNGAATLAELFEGRRQLIVYHFMLEPGGEPCTGCSMFVDTLGHPAHLNARDTTLALVSRAPQGEVAAVRARLGWERPWYSSADDFSADCGITDGFGLSVFIRDGNRIFRNYFTDGRALDAIGNHWSLLDLTPLGRQESWEETPAGRPQTPPYEWWRLHDEYDA
jgi:predicted dithiol-disulfide oxidoreductase (DUF899 family)